MGVGVGVGGDRAEGAWQRGLLCAAGVRESVGGAGGGDVREAR